MKEQVLFDWTPTIKFGYGTVIDYGIRTPCTAYESSTTLYDLLMNTLKKGEAKKEFNQAEYDYLSGLCDRLQSELDSFRQYIDFKLELTNSQS